MNLLTLRNADRGVSKLFWAWIAYSIFTVLFFQFGPYYFGHPLGELIWLYIFLFFSHAAIISGFLFEIRRPVKPSRPLQLLERHFDKLPYLAICSVVLELLVRLFIYEGIGGLADARAAWHESSGSLASHAILWSSSITLPVIAVAFARWSRFSLFQKLCLLACIGGEYLFTVMGGTRHGAFIVSLILGFLFFTKFEVNGKWFAKYFLLNIAALLVVGFAVYSSIVTMNRYGLDVRDVTFEELNRKQGRLGNVLDPDHPLVASDIPNYLKPAMISGTYYFGHGYGALAHAISLPQDFPSMGIGHSLFLTRTAQKLGLYPVAAKTYIVRLNDELGYMIPQTWMTGYTWFASDLTFYGVVPFLFLLSMILCRAWRCFAIHSDLYAALALVWLLNIFIQLPLLFPGQDYVPLALIYSSIGLFLLQQRKA